MSSNPNPQSHYHEWKMIIILVLCLLIIGLGISYYFRVIQPSKMLKSNAPINQVPIATNKPVVVTSNNFLEVVAPTPYQSIKSPVLVAGRSSFFEANTRIRIRDEQNNILADTFTTAEGWMDNKLYPFTKNVDYIKPVTQQGVVEIFGESPADGRAEHMISLPVTFSDFGETSNITSVQWQTYTNSYPKYSLKYPGDWKLDTSRAVIKPNANESAILTLTKKGHKFEINQPSGWGPSVCRYPETPEQPEGPGFPGKDAIITDYVEIRSRVATYIFRRPSIPQQYTDLLTWHICQKEAASEFFTNATVVDVITYSVPVNYDPAIVKEMDSILKTIKSEK